MMNCPKGISTNVHVALPRGLPVKPGNNRGRGFELRYCIGLCASGSKGESECPSSASRPRRHGAEKSGKRPEQLVWHRNAPEASMTITRVTMQPGAVSTLHVHAKAEQIG